MSKYRSSGAHSHTKGLNGSRNKQKTQEKRHETEAEQRFLNTLQAPRVHDDTFLNSLTEDAAANIVWYRDHFRMLTQAEISSSVLQAALAVEGLDEDNVTRISTTDTSRAVRAICDELGPNPYLNGFDAGDGTTFMLPINRSVYRVSCAYANPLKREETNESSRRTILCFEDKMGYAYSSAFLRHAPSFATVINALPRMLARKSALIGQNVTIDQGRWERYEKQLNKKKELIRRVRNKVDKNSIIDSFLEPTQETTANKVFLRIRLAGKVDGKQFVATAKSLAEAECVYGSKRVSSQQILHALDSCIGDDLAKSETQQLDNSAILAGEQDEDVADSGDLRRILDLKTDEGGAREETSFFPGDVCWLSALPGSELPSIARHVLAELSVVNIGHNLVQAMLATHDTVALGDISSYPGLTQRPFLMNHLWTQHAKHQPLQYSSLKGSKVQSSMLDAYSVPEISDSFKNVPIPSPLCPLEAIVVEVNKNSIGLEVDMPKALAKQWFTPLPPQNKKKGKSNKSEKNHTAIPVPLPQYSNSMADVLSTTKQHVIAQTNWPLAAPANTRWLLVRGPNTLMQERTASALNTLTSGAFSSSDAVRHIVCRMEGLPTLDSEASRAALARVLQLDNRGFFANTGTGPEELLRALNKKESGRDLLSIIDDLNPLNNKLAPTSSALETQWARVKECAMRPGNLNIIVEELGAEEVCALARTSTLVIPATLLESTRSQLEVDAILCRRLRQLEFARQNYMSERDSGVGVDVEGNDEEVETTQTLTTAGRFYFRRMPAHVEDSRRASATYEWHSPHALLSNVRVNSDILTKGLSIASPTYHTSMKTFLGKYKSTQPHPAALPFPSPSQRVMHPQANHNPLPYAELTRAAAILRQLPQLNPSQRKAIMSVFNQSLSLIQGPPGTGKTQTISTLVWLWVCALGGKLPFPDKKLPFPEEFLARFNRGTVAAGAGKLYTPDDFTRLNDDAVEKVVCGTLDSENEMSICLQSTAPHVAERDARHTPPPPPTPTSQIITPLNVSGRGPVLISAYSNCAIDEICLRLLQMPGFKVEGDKTPPYTIIRIGRPEKMNPALKEATLAWHLEHNEAYLAKCRQTEEDIRHQQAKLLSLQEMCEYLTQMRGLIDAELQRKRAKADELLRNTNQRIAVPTDISMTFTFPPHVQQLKRACGCNIPSSNILSRRDIVEHCETLTTVEESTTRAIQKLRMDLRDARRTFEDLILRQASVVIGTCMGVGSTVLDQLRFSLVVVDECSQVPESACLIPISKLAPCHPEDLIGDVGEQSIAWRRILGTRATRSELSAKWGFHPSQRSPGSFSRVVLVGDQCQLPPVVDKERMKLARTHISLFERLMSAVPHAVSSIFFRDIHTNNPSNTCLKTAPVLAPHTSLLHTQYRMHAALASWISTNIYNSRITSGTHPAHRKCPPGFPWPVTFPHYGDRFTTKRVRGHAVCKLMFLLENMVQKHQSKDVLFGRFALDLMQNIRASPAMEHLLPSHVPHKTLDGILKKKKTHKELHLFRECWCGCTTDDGKAHRHALSLELEVAAHILKTKLPVVAVGHWNGKIFHLPSQPAQHLVQQLPMLFVDVPVDEDARGLGASKSNITEAQFVAHTAASLLGALPEVGECLGGHLSNLVACSAKRAVTERKKGGTAEDANTGGWLAKSLRYKLNISERLNTVESAEKERTTASHAELLRGNHHLSERIGNVEERTAWYRLVSRALLISGVSASKGARVTAEEIGVVTPYVGQVREVKNALNTLHKACVAEKLDSKQLTKVEVKSVDGFQGREKDVIIMTCVRSNQAGNIGFLADLRRLNVAVSRAKRGLIIVGNQKTLRTNALWSSYLDSLAKAGAIVHYDDLVPWMVAGTAFPSFL